MDSSSLLSSAWSSSSSKDRGAELSFRSKDGRSRFDLSIDYLDAGIEQLNVNPDTPRDLGKAGAPPVGVAQAFDFPEQTNTSTTVEAKYVRKLTTR